MNQHAAIKNKKIRAEFILKFALDKSDLKYHLEQSKDEKSKSYDYKIINESNSRSLYVELKVIKIKLASKYINDYKKNFYNPSMGNVLFLCVDDEENLISWIKINNKSIKEKSNNDFRDLVKSLKDDLSG